MTPDQLRLGLRLNWCGESKFGQPRDESGQPHGVAPYNSEKLPKELHIIFIESLDSCLRRNDMNRQSAINK